MWQPEVYPPPGAMDWGGREHALERTGWGTQSRSSEDREGGGEVLCYLTFPGVPPPSLGGPGWERAPLLQLREVWRLSCWPSCFPPLAPLTLTAPAQTPLPSVFSIASFHNAHPCPSLEVNFKFSQQVFCTSAFIAKCCRCKPPLSPKTVFGILCALFFGGCY